MQELKVADFDLELPPASDSTRDNSVLGDGVWEINIGSTAKTALGRLLGWYDTTPKLTHEGREFYMYAGYHYYLITQGDNHRFLKAVSRQELKASARYMWENVVGLETSLESLLSYNLHRSPLAIPLLVKHDLPIVWTEPDLRGLRNAEKRWLRVVQKTVRRLRNEYKSS